MIASHRLAAVALLLAFVAIGCGDPDDPVRPAPTFAASATAAVSPDAEATPTSTFVPPHPDSITPHPTSRPVTPEPRTRMPEAADIMRGANGRYYAEVDGCRWDEYGRFPDPATGIERVHLSTPCLPSEAIFYDPNSGDIEHAIS